jgi:hypothetical protein
MLPHEAALLTALCLGKAKPTPANQAAALAAITRAVQEAHGDPATLQKSLPGATATVADLDSDSAGDTIITFAHCGIPPVIYRGAAPGRPILARTPDPPTWTGPGGSRVDRVADINSDGRPELVIESQIAGASALHTILAIYQWQSDHLATLFTDHLTNWVGENRWSIGPGTVTTQCHPFGPFEYKMTEHRQQTETYRWDPAARRYTRQSCTIEPPSTRLLQASEAERLFQEGRYAAALPRYLAIEGIPVTADDPRQADWAAYGHLRAGQIHALAGRKAEAIAELKRAEQGRAPIPALAAAFREAYSQQDAAAGFTALWRAMQPLAFAPKGTEREKLWPFMLDPQMVGARRAMLDAYQRAERTPPEGLLPEDIELPKQDCLGQTWG